MSPTEKPLQPGDFPLKVDGDKVRKQDGSSIAVTPTPTVAAELAERLNEDEDRREEDKWSA